MNPSTHYDGQQEIYVIVIGYSILKLVRSKLKVVSILFLTPFEEQFVTPSPGNQDVSASTYHAIDSCWVSCLVQYNLKHVKF